MLERQSREEDALADYKTALKIKPDAEQVRLRFAQLLQKRDRHTEALEQYELVIQANPDCADAHHGRGEALRRLGFAKRACESYQRTLELRPDNLRVLVDYYGYECETKDKSCILSAICRLKDALAEKNKSFGDPAFIQFTLAKMYEQLTDYDMAFAHFSRGRQVLAQASESTWDPGFAKIDWLCKTMTPAFFAERHGWGHDSERPIFIVGMPRSGTTLVEQVLSSHSDVYGAGERLWIHQTASPLVADNNAPIGPVSPEKMRALAQQYLAYLDQSDATAVRVTDKFPHNFLYLWLIALLFPKATIIHCQRDPMATCWSIFSHPFRHGHPYANRLDTLGQHYRQYQVLMAHWEQALPIPIYSVRYEQLVREPISTIRALLDHCRLSFEQACLAPHLNDRPVQTSSSNQVIKPIYTNRIDYWQNYKPYLMDLHHALHGQLKESEI
ncbi:hypothetical protein CKO36_18250 [Rhabdochromatium marinum]|nr:hypothetical protein [Rhabdochromatium marinum]